MSNDEQPLEDFQGTVRIFPLPNLVLFPHVGQPLHIFEPRYRAMMAAALEDDMLLGMALLRTGWEEDYHLQPPIHAMICIGRIVQHEVLPDGRYNLLLLGVTRARIVEELDTATAFRVARVEVCPDEPIEDSERDYDLRQQLAECAEPFFVAHPQAMEQLRQLVGSEMTTGALCDVLSFALPLSVECKQRLLNEICVEARVSSLCQELSSILPPPPPDSMRPKGPRRAFPPSFSEN
jgi:Lon protease-like protein